MRVRSYITAYLAIFLLLVLSAWATIFYYAMLDEIYDSIDDGLDNQKGLILQKLVSDSSLLSRGSFDEGDYSIREISRQSALQFQDLYIDTLVYTQNEEDYEPVRMLKTAFEQQGRYYQLQIVTSTVEEDDLVRKLFYSLIWLYVGLMITILLVNNFLLKRTYRPFYHLVNQLRTFRLEQPSINVMPTRIREFRLLNDAVQKMVQSNIDSYTSQKSFLENASHELQTPLAVILNKLETLAQSRNFTEEESKLLESALDNLARLTRLNRSLLLLSKIENRQFHETAQVNLNDLSREMIQDFEDQLSFLELDISFKEEAECTVQMNPDLARILVTNLLKNAIVHNRKGGEIIITLRANSLQVENTAIDGPLDATHLYDRFHKQDQSRSSTGLGLAIVKAIIQFYRFRVEYGFTGLHRFTVWF